MAAAFSDGRVELEKVDKGKVLKAVPGTGQQLRSVSSASLTMLGFQGDGSQFSHPLSWAHGHALSLLWRYINSD